MLNQRNNSVQTNGTSENLVSGDATTQMKVRIAKLETLLKVSSQVCIEGECLRQLCSVPMQNDNTLTCPKCHSDYLSNGQNCSKTDNGTMTDFEEDVSFYF